MKKNYNEKTQNIDGHNLEEIYSAVKDEEKDLPKAIIANTIKGKGFSFSENNNDWHHKIMTKSNYEEALKELKSND